MFELIGLILLVVGICSALALALCFLSGRRGHGLNGHYQKPSEEELQKLRDYNKQDVAFTMALHNGRQLDEELDATEFFHKAEGYRRDFA